MQPPLAYTAPELVAAASMATASDAPLSGAADCFSLAAITYQLLTGRQLLPVGSSTGEYRSRLGSLAAGGGNMAALPAPLQVWRSWHGSTLARCVRGPCVGSTCMRCAPRPF